MVVNVRRNDAPMIHYSHDIMNIPSRHHGCFNPYGPMVSPLLAIPLQAGGVLGKRAEFSPGLRDRPIKAGSRDQRASCV